MDTIPLLSAPARIIRDAAGAVKRVAGLAIQQVTAGTLTQLLGLPGVVVTEYALKPHSTRSSKDWREWIP